MHRVKGYASKLSLERGTVSAEALLEVISFNSAQLTNDRGRNGNVVYAGELWAELNDSSLKT